MKRLTFTKNVRLMLTAVVLCFGFAGTTFGYDPQILLDPGHKNDANNLGALGACYPEIHEWQLTFPYADEAYKEILASSGVGSYNWAPRITRLHNGIISIGDRVRMANNDGGSQRDAYEDPIATNGVDLFLSVHCNSNEGDPGHGSEVLYCDHQETIFDLGEECYSFASVILAHYIYHTGGVLKNAVERDAPVVLRNDLQVLRDTVMPSALVETEFINNPSVCDTMNTVEYVDAVGIALKESIIYLEWFWQTTNLAAVISSDIASSTNWPISSPQNRTILVRNPNYKTGWATKDYFVTNGSMLSIFDNAVVVLDKNVRLTPTLGSFVACFEEAKILERSGAKLTCGFGTEVNTQDSAPPEEFSLTPNFPNPFAPSTEFHCSLPYAGKVTVEIFDALGRQVSVLLDEIRPAGQHALSWNGNNNQGIAVAPGSYFYKASYVPFGRADQAIVRTGKMSLLR